MPHFWGLILAGPGFLVRNLCKFQNFGLTFLVLVPGLKVKMI